MWWVGSSTMIRRAGLSCRGKDAKEFILSALVVLSSFSRSKIAGYTAKELVLCCLLHVSANVEADLCGRGGIEGFAGSYLVCSWVVSFGCGDVVGGTSGGGTGPFPTCPHSIASSSPVVVVGICGACGAGGVGFSLSVLSATSPWSISIIFLR